MSRRGLWLFVTLGVAWGIPYLLIKIAVTELSPAELVLARTTLAALLLLPIATLRGAIRPALRRWKPVAAFTLVEIAIPWLFLNRAETRLPSSTTGLLIAAVPLVGLLVAFLMGRAERLGRVGWLGLAFGFAGVAALVGLDVGGSDLVAVAELGVVVVGYAVGPAILARWLDDTPAIGVIAVALTATALMLPPDRRAHGRPADNDAQRFCRAVGAAACGGLHGARVPRAVRPRGRDRSGSRDHDYLRQPGRGRCRRCPRAQRAGDRVDGTGVRAGRHRLGAGESPPVGARRATRAPVSCSPSAGLFS